MTALKTISARIRGAKTELEDMGEETEFLAEGFSKYANELKSLTGFSIIKEGTTDEYKNLYEIFEGLSTVWDKLSDTTKARVSEILGGTRQLQVVSSIFNNWGDAVGAYQDAMNAVEVSTSANDIYMETTAAHIEQMKAAFQELSMTLVNNGISNTFVDLVKYIIEFGTALADILSPAISVVGSLLDGFVSIIKDLKGSLSGLNSDLFEKILGNGDVGTWLSRAGLTAVMTAIGGPVGGGIALVLNLISILKDLSTQSIRAQQDFSDAASVMLGNAKETESKTEDFKLRIAELKEKLSDASISSVDMYNAQKSLVDIKQELIDTFGSEAYKIDLLKTSADEAAESIDKLAQSQIQQNAVDFLSDPKKLKAGEEAYRKMADVTTTNAYGNDIDLQPYITTDLIPEYRELIKKGFSDIFEIMDDGNGGFSIEYHVGVKTEDALSAINNLKTSVYNLNEEFGGSKETDPFEEWLNTQANILRSEIDTYGENASSYITAKIYASDDLTSINSSMNAAINDYNIALTKEYASEQDRVEALKAATSELAEVQNQIQGKDFSNSGIGVSEYFTETINSAVASADEAVKASNSIINAENKLSNSKGYLEDRVRTQNELNEELRETVRAYNDMAHGNVNYGKRPGNPGAEHPDFITAEEMWEAGWKDFQEGDLATTYSYGKTIGEGEYKFSVEVTPILEDGTVLSPEALDDYVNSLYTGGSLDDLLLSDEDGYGIIINAVEGDWDKEYWSRWNERLQEIKDHHMEIVQELETAPELSIETSEAYEELDDFEKNVVSAIDELSTGDGVVKLSEILNGQLEYDNENLISEKRQLAPNYEGAAKAYDAINKAANEAGIGVSDLINLLIESGLVIDDTAEKAVDSSQTFSEAYNKWKTASNAKSDATSYEIATSAFDQLQTALDNMKTGDDTKYQVAVDFVVPKDVDPSDEASIRSYLTNVSKYFTEDFTGLQQFNLDLINEDSLNGISSSAEEVADVFKITLDDAKILLNTLKQYDFDTLSLKAMSTISSNLKSESDALTKARDEIISSGFISPDNLSALLKYNEAYSNAISEENGKLQWHQDVANEVYTNDVDRMIDVAEAQREIAIESEDLEQAEWLMYWIASLKETKKNVDSLGGSVSKLTKIESENSAVENILSATKEGTTASYEDFETLIKEDERYIDCIQRTSSGYIVNTQLLKELNLERNNGTIAALEAEQKLYAEGTKEYELLGLIISRMKEATSKDVIFNESNEMYSSIKAWSEVLSSVKETQDAGSSIGYDAVKSLFEGETKNLSALKFFMQNEAGDLVVDTKAYDEYYRGILDWYIDINQQKINSGELSDEEAMKLALLVQDAKNLKEEMYGVAAKASEIAKLSSEKTSIENILTAQSSVDSYATYDSFNELIKLNQEYVGCLEKTADGYRLNTSAAVDLYHASLDAKINDIERAQTGLDVNSKLYKSYQIQIDQLRQMQQEYTILKATASGMSSTYSYISGESEKINSIIASQDEDRAVGISAEDYQALIKYDESYANMLSYENGVWKLNAEVSERSLKSKIDKQIEALKAERDLNKEDSSLVATYNVTISNLERLSNTYSRYSTAISKTTKGYTKLKSAYTSIISALKEQGYAGNISADTYNSLVEIMPEFADCLDVSSGGLQINYAKTMDLVRANGLEQLSQIKVNRALEQSKYDEATREIAKLKAAEKDLTSAGKQELENWKQKQQEAQNNINKYDMMRRSVLDMCSAYQQWLSLKDASNSDEMRNEMAEAAKEIKEGLTSGMTGIGNVQYQAAVELLVPQDIDRSAKSVAAYYNKVLYRYLTDDGRTGAQAFWTDMQKMQLAVADASGKVNIAEGQTLSSISKAMNMTYPMVMSMINYLEMFEGFSFDFTDEEVAAAQAEYLIQKISKRIDELNSKPVKTKAETEELDLLEKQLSDLQDAAEIVVTPDVDQEALAAAEETISQVYDSATGDGDAFSLEETLTNIATNLESIAEAIGAIDLGDIGADEASQGVDTVKQGIEGIVETISGMSETKLDLGIEEINTGFVTIAKSLIALRTEIDSINDSVKLSIGLDEINDAFITVAHSLIALRSEIDNINSTVKLDIGLSEINDQFITIARSFIALNSEIANIGSVVSSSISLGNLVALDVVVDDLARTSTAAYDGIIKSSAAISIQDEIAGDALVNMSALDIAESGAITSSTSLKDEMIKVAANISLAGDAAATAAEKITELNDSINGSSSTGDTVAASIGGEDSSNAIIILKQKIDDLKDNLDSLGSYTIGDLGVDETNTLVETLKSNLDLVSTTLSTLSATNMGSLGSTDANTKVSGLLTSVAAIGLAIDDLNSKIIGDLGSEATKQSIIDLNSTIDSLALKSVGDLGISNISSSASAAKGAIDSLQGSINSLQGKSIDIDVNVKYNYSTTTSGPSSHSSSSYGNGYAYGTGQAAANGGAKSGKTLVGELGTEIVVSNGMYHTVGEDGAEIVDLNEGDIVFNAEDTKKILSGQKGARGIALAEGNAMVTGGGSSKLPSPIYVNGSSGSGSSSSSDSSSDDDSNWFKDQYNLYKHLVEMNKMETEEFLEWLKDAWPQAYAQGLLEIDDAYSKEEEYYNGIHSLVNDKISDEEFVIDKLEKEGATVDQLAEKWQDLANYIQNQINIAYLQGLDDTDDYVQGLWNSYYSIINKITDAQDSATDSAKSNLESLVKYRMKMIEKDKANQKSALKDQLSDLKDYISKQKELLDDANDEEEYIEQQAEYRKTVSDLENQLNQLEYDNSAWAQKRKLQLQEDLKDAQKQLSDFEKDHALDAAKKALDDAYDTAEEKINDQIDVIDEYLENKENVYLDALRDVQNNTLQLFEEMVAFEKYYGEGYDDPLVKIWDEAYEALRKYYDLNKQLYREIDLLDATNSYGGGRITGYASGTSNATSGLHRLFEKGDEYIFSSSDGNRYKMFSGGEKVLNAGATKFLYDFANSGSRSYLSMMETFASKMSDLSYINSMQSPAQNISMGDIIINGNATEQTVSEIRRAQRENMNNMLKKLSSLSR